MAKKRNGDFIRKLVPIIILIAVIATAIVILKKRNTADSLNPKRVADKNFTPEEKTNQDENANTDRYVIEEPINGGLYTETRDDGTIVNKSDALKTEKTYGIYKFSNMQITYKNKVTLLTATVTNTSDEDRSEQYVNIVVYKNPDEEYMRFGGIISYLKAGESGTFSAEIYTEDMTDVYDIEIVDRTPEELKAIEEDERAAREANPPAPEAEENSVVEPAPEDASIPTELPIEDVVKANPADASEQEN